MIGYDPDNAEHRELKSQDLYEKRYRFQLMSHPNCRDPDHPGCPECDDDDTQDYEDDADDIQGYK